MEYIVRIVISGLMLVVPPDATNQPYRLILPDTSDLGGGCETGIAKHDLRIFYRDGDGTDEIDSLPEGFFHGRFSWEEKQNQVTVPSEPRDPDGRPFPPSKNTAARRSFHRTVDLSDLLGEEVTVTTDCLSESEDAGCPRRALLDLADGALTTLRYIAEGRVKDSEPRARLVKIGRIHRALSEIGLVEARADAASGFTVGLGAGEPRTWNEGDFRECGTDRCLDLWIHFSPPLSGQDDSRRTPGEHFQLLYPLVGRSCKTTDPCHIPWIVADSDWKPVGDVDPPMSYELPFPDGSLLVAKDKPGSARPRKVLNPPICPYAKP